MDNGSQHTSEPSVAALLGGIVNDVKDLLVQELALTKLEVQDTLRKAKTAAIALGIGIGVVAIGGMLLMLDAGPGAGGIHGDSALGVLRHRGGRTGRPGWGAARHGQTPGRGHRRGASADA